MGQEFDTTLLTRLVSEMYGSPISVEWGDYRNMPEDTLGVANCYVIRLRSSLARNADPILPRVFYHELAHVLLHKRGGVEEASITQEQKEKEAELFANEMLLRFGDEFVWNALTDNLRYDDERRAKEEMMRFADSKIFRRNQVKPEPYQYASQGDVSIKWHRQPQASVHQRQRMTASELEAQGRRELALAAKVSNPQVAEMIRRSANEKLGQTATNGRRSGASYADAPFETATLRR